MGVRELQDCPVDFQRKFRVHSPIYSSENSHETPLKGALNYPKKVTFAPNY